MRRRTWWTPASTPRRSLIPDIDPITGGAFAVHGLGRNAGGGDLRAGCADFQFLRRVAAHQRLRGDARLEWSAVYSPTHPPVAVGVYAATVTVTGDSTGSAESVPATP